VPSNSNSSKRKAETGWREELVEASKNAMGSLPGHDEQASLRYTVELDFFVMSESVDLDNLTKPILDTLFSPGLDNPDRDHLREITGKVFPAAHDSRVFTLIQRKTVVSGSEKQGVKVTVSWSGA
jgi:hypothetical protein